MKQIIETEQPPLKEAFVSACEHGYDTYNHAPRKAVCQIDKTVIEYEPRLELTEVEALVQPEEKTVNQTISEEETRIAQWEARIAASRALIDHLRLQPLDKPIGEVGPFIEGRG